MYGIEAITANNGWVMAAVGALIVFSGLVILSFTIAQLHKLVDLWEKKDSFLKRNQTTLAANHTESQPAGQFPRRLPTEISEVASLYQPLVDELGEPFQLSELHEASRLAGDPHPHLTITALRSANILVPRGDGVFIWNPPQNGERK